MLFRGLAPEAQVPAKWVAAAGRKIDRLTDSFIQHIQFRYTDRQIDR